VDRVPPAEPSDATSPTWRSPNGRAPIRLRAARGRVVAAHPSDLDAARDADWHGLLPRPLEHGPGGGAFELVAPGRFDWQASDFADLAARLENGA
jgi:hypothetical protein